MKLPSDRGEQVKGEFNDFFSPYQRIGIGDLLITNPSMPSKLTKCPLNAEAEYVVEDINEKGLVFKKVIITIERV